MRLSWMFDCDLPFCLVLGPSKVEEVTVTHPDQLVVWGIRFWIPHHCGWLCGFIPYHR